jgi:hypothetical protein
MLNIEQGTRKYEEDIQMCRCADICMGRTADVYKTTFSYKIRSKKKKGHAAGVSPYVYRLN